MPFIFVAGIIIGYGVAVGAALGVAEYVQPAVKRGLQAAEDKITDLREKRRAKKAASLHSIK